MKKIVPFKHDIPFKNNLAEIVSISLDHELKLSDNVVRGNLIIGGSYKMNDVSINTEEFKYNIPVNIEMNDKYDLSNLDISIADFYYEIIDNKILSVNIEISLDNLEEKIEPIVFKEELQRDITGDVKSLFDNLDEEDEYATYQICIVKEEDNIESILLRYEITKDLLEQYNDISDIKVGDKLIIPSHEKCE